MQKFAVLYQTYIYQVHIRIWQVRRVIELWFIGTNRLPGHDINYLALSGVLSVSDTPISSH